VGSVSRGEREPIPQQITMKKTNPETSCGRCALHVRAIIRNPSRFAFYACGIMREFKQASFFALCMGGSVLFVFGISLVNLFF
jgi:hypothetical protein